MVLIIGGAYQGKLDYAVKTYHLTPEDIFTCAGGELDFSRRCVTGIAEFTWFCAQGGIDPIPLFRRHRDKWRESILICRDIFCGVVPMDPRERAWREATGKLCQYLAGEADRVVRIFCGLPEVLK